MRSKIALLWLRVRPINILNSTLICIQYVVDTLTLPMSFNIMKFSRSTAIINPPPSDIKTWRWIWRKNKEWKILKRYISYVRIFTLPFHHPMHCYSDHRARYRLLLHPVITARGATRVERGRLHNDRAAWKAAHWNYVHISDI